MIKLDHIAVAARTLKQGVDYIQALLGVEPSGGGRHLKQGTHNKLLNLGKEVYLEIIAPDPESTLQPAWFGLADRALLESLAERPRLLTYVAQTDEIETILRSTGYPLEARPAERGNLRWQFGFSKDGSLLGDGMLPYLIQWQGEHPTQTLPPNACTLVRLQGFHPNPAPIQQTLQELGFADITVQYGDTSSLQAMIQTFSGLKMLS
ncbi:MAG: VOC family protein [Trueperaceae bacterium]